MEETLATIRLDTIRKVDNFVEIVTKFDEEITIKSHRYEIDAKSIMAIFSLNLLEPITCCLYSDDKKIQLEFLNKIKKYTEEIWWVFVWLVNRVAAKIMLQEN